MRKPDCGIVAVAEQAGLSMTWSKNLKTRSEVNRMLEMNDADVYHGVHSLCLRTARTEFLMTWLLNP